MFTTKETKELFHERDLSAYRSTKRSTGNFAHSNDDDVTSVSQKEKHRRAKSKHLKTTRSWPKLPKKIKKVKNRRKMLKRMKKQVKQKLKSSPGKKEKKLLKKVKRRLLDTKEA